MEVFLDMNERNEEIRKQQLAGKLTARERIRELLDPDSFFWLFAIFCG